jgi:hypothetical protein
VEGSGGVGEGSRSLWRNFWWREGLGSGGMGLWVWGESLGSFGGLGFGEESWEERRRLEGEKVTVAEILGAGVGGFGREGCGVEEGEGEGEGFDGVLGFEAKKRDITCCFCLPMTVVVVVVVEEKPNYLESVS